jgi:hypothetical protein
MTMLPDIEKKNSYCGCDIKDGQLRLLFGEDKLGTNISYCFEYLEKGLSNSWIWPFLFLIFQI